MRRLQDFFENQEPVLVYIARKLREAQALEVLLTASGVDYLVEADSYHGGIIFQTERVGAFFYVLPDHAERTRRLLEENGYLPHEALE